MGVFWAAPLQSAAFLCGVPQGDSPQWIPQGIPPEDPPGNRPEGSTQGSPGDPPGDPPGYSRGTPWGIRLGFPREKIPEGIRWGRPLGGSPRVGRRTRGPRPPHLLSIRNGGKPRHATSTLSNCRNAESNHLESSSSNYFHPKIRSGAELKTSQKTLFW